MNRFRSLLLCLPLCISGCAGLTKEDAKNAKDVTKTVVSIADSICIALHAFEPPAAVRVACNIVDLTDEQLKSAMSATQRQAVSHAAKQNACAEPKDAGKR